MNMFSTGGFSASYGRLIFWHMQCWDPYSVGIVIAYSLARISIIPNSCFRFSTSIPDGNSVHCFELRVIHLGGFPYIFKMIFCSSTFTRRSVWFNLEFISFFLGGVGGLPYCLRSRSVHLFSFFYIYLSFAVNGLVLALSGLPNGLRSPQLHSHSRICINHDGDRQKVRHHHKHHVVARKDRLIALEYLPIISNSNCSLSHVLHDVETGRKVF